jgi:hypothetical protein
MVVFVQVEQVVQVDSFSQCVAVVKFDENVSKWASRRIRISRSVGRAFVNHGTSRGASQRASLSDGVPEEEASALTEVRNVCDLQMLTK